MKKKLFPMIVFPLLAIISGSVCAVLAVTVHTAFFVILPILVFAFSYFSSWTGFLCGLFLFLQYTFTTIYMLRGTDPLWPDMAGANQYFIKAFISGGFILLLIGILTPLLRKRLQKTGMHNITSIAVFITLACSIFICGALAWSKTRTSYDGCYYQFRIYFTEDLADIEVYLPAAAVSGNVYEDLYNNPDPMIYIVPDTPSEYAFDFVDTQYGRMIKLSIPELYKLPYYPGKEYSHTAYLFFRQGNPPHEPLKFTPKHDITYIDEVTWQREFYGPWTIDERKQVEEFTVPVMVNSATDAPFKVSLDICSNQSQMINFDRCIKSRSYLEKLINCKGSTTNGWILVSGSATSVQSLVTRGMMD